MSAKAGIQERYALACGKASWMPGLALLARNDAPPFLKRNTGFRENDVCPGSESKSLSHNTRAFVLGHLTFNPCKRTHPFPYYRRRYLDGLDPASQYSQRFMAVRYATDRYDINLSFGGMKHQFCLR